MVGSYLGYVLDYMGMGQNMSKPCTPVVHIKIAGIGKWMFIPCKKCIYIYIYTVRPPSCKLV